MTCASATYLTLPQTQQCSSTRKVCSRTSARMIHMIRRFAVTIAKPSLTEGIYDVPNEAESRLHTKCGALCRQWQPDSNCVHQLHFGPDGHFQYKNVHAFAIQIRRAGDAAVGHMHVRVAPHSSSIASRAKESCCVRLCRAKACGVKWILL